MLEPEEYSLNHVLDLSHNSYLVVNGKIRCTIGAGKVAAMPPKSLHTSSRGFNVNNFSDFARSFD